ncbi:MAG: amino acid--[acyl-carrier-protein] ligase [Chromatiales bacterium]
MTTIASKYSVQEFYDGLVAHKLIIPVGVAGAFARTAVFEDVLNRFDNLVTRLTSNDGAEAVTYPPILNRKVFEKSGYLKSFPHLAGTIFSFSGTNAQLKELLQRVEDDKPWADLQGMTDVVLTPAACYPVYPSFTGTVPAAGRLIDTTNWVFRHEPSPEPTRMQAFRMREFIRVGRLDVVIEWLNMWLQRGLDVLQGLGLSASSDAASDPFFGRGGRMLAANQKDQKLKFEILIPVISEEKQTAVCSFNYHQDHFGHTFEIHTEDGAYAQTACMGFGMERVTMALFSTHGFVPAEWPKSVRDQLWP